MAQQFNPKRVLRQVSTPLLRDFFGRKAPDLDLKWDDIQGLTINDIFDAWQRLPDAQRKNIEMVFHDIAEMASDEDGVKVIQEESLTHGENLGTRLESMDSRYDKALWTYMNRPHIWEAAIRFAKADILSVRRSWVKRSEVPKAEPKTDEEGRKKLAVAISAFYREQEARGHNCTVEHFARGAGHDYYFVYLSDYADTHINFSDSGDLCRTTERRAFEVVFAYDRENTTLDMFARGGKKVVEPLQKIFCEVILGQCLKNNVPGRKPYCLDKLLDRNFAFPTDPEDNVESVSIRTLRLSIIGRTRGRITLDADPAKSPDNIYDMLAEDLNRKNLPLSVLCVTKATLHLKLKGYGRIKGLAFNVSIPDACDLKSKREDLRLLGEKYLRRWKIDVS
jgi:hypothetical protein